MDSADEDRWRDEMAYVVELMRDLSRETDPQAAAERYAHGIRSRLVPADVWISVSRRDLTPPLYRITRFSGWPEAINPWEEKDRLPVFDRGLLGELIYSNEPSVIDDLPSLLRSDDPAYEYLRGMKLMVTLPQYDDGVALNMGVLLVADPERSGFPRQRIPVMVWQANLWGRAVMNLVLKNRLQLAYDALDRELKKVAHIQRSLLPPALPVIEGIDLASHYQTAQRAGGDYYDFFPLEDGRWGILIADVSGHSAPAAVMMAVTHAIAHCHPGPATPPSAVLSYVNERLVEGYAGALGTFVTALFAVYDPRSRTLTHANAGHNPPRWRRRGEGGAYEVVGMGRASAPPLGIDARQAYVDVRHELSVGDAVLFYTDGIIEARSPSREMFDTERLDHLLVRHHDGAARLVDEILSALNRFTADAVPADDRTLLAMLVTR